MSTDKPWSDLTLKATPVGADVLAILDSEDTDPNTINKTVTIGSIPGFSAVSLDDLTDVVITSPTLNDILVSDSEGVWINRQGIFSGITGLGIQSQSLDMNNNTIENSKLPTDTNFFVDATDETKKLAFGLSGFTTATTRTITIPNSSTTLVGTDIIQTLSLKTLIIPVIGDFTNAIHTHADAPGGAQLTATNALDATGTKDSTTFLRGDNTWDVPPGIISNLNDLSDVTITPPTVNDLLVSDVEGVWINRQGIFTGITGTGTLTTGTWNADTITVLFGGTGATSFTDNAVLIGNATGAIEAIGTGTTGQLLISAGSGSSPAFGDIAAQSLSDGFTFIGDESNIPKGFPAGFEAKQDCVIATTANITLANTQVIDGVAVNNPDRVLIKNQTNASENGIYVVIDVGTWTRSTDADTNSEVNNGMLTLITQGNTQANTAWSLSTLDPIVLDTTDLEFQQYSLVSLAHLNTSLLQTFSGDITVNGVLSGSDNVVSQNSLTTTEVFALSDLPTPVSGVITIPSGKYFFKTNIDFGTNRIVFPALAEVVFEGDNTLESELKFTAASNTFITAADLDILRFQSINILMFGSNGKMFDITNGTIQIFDTDMGFDDTATGTRSLGSFLHPSGGGFFGISVAEFFSYLDGLTITIESLNIANVTLFPDGAGTAFDINGLDIAAVFDTLGFIGTASNQILFDIDNSITGQMDILNVFDLGGSGTFYAGGGLDQTSPLVTALNNGVSPDSMTIGEARSTGTLLVNIVTQNVAVPVVDTTPVPGDWIQDSATERFSIDTTTGIITYDGIRPITVTIQYQVAAQLTTGSNTTYEFTINKNGSPVTKTIISTLVPTTSAFVQIIYVGGIFNLETGDTIQLFCTNVSNTNDVDVKATSVLVQRA